MTKAWTVDRGPWTVDRGAPASHAPRPTPHAPRGLPHRFVLVCGAVFGVSLVFLAPPFSSPDELAHFLRAYHCSQGKVYAIKHGRGTGDYLPVSLCETYVAIAQYATKDDEFAISWNRFDLAKEIRLDPRRESFLSFGNMALYSPVPYAPQAVALSFARFWEMRPLYMVYVARLANLTAYLLLVVTAVRIAPVQKWTLALVALMPMAVYLAASLSADGVTIGLSLLIVAMTMDLAMREGPADWRRLATLGLLLVLLALSKQAYLGMVLLIFVVPGDKFGSRGRRWLVVALMIGVPLAIEAAWAYSLRNLYVPIKPYVDPAAQARWIVTHPGAYVSVMFKEMWKFEHHSLMVGVFGWLGRPFWRWMLNTYWIALAATAVLDGGRRFSLNLRTRLIVFGTYVASAAIMETFVYLSWEHVGQKNIEGVQPRYLVPIVPLLLLTIRGGQALAASRFSRIVVPRAAMAASALAVLATWWIFYKRYYW